MDESKTNLIINKLQSKAIYDYLAANNKIGINELYLVANDDAETVSSVQYDNNDRKLTYTDENGNITDIITVQALKNAMFLSRVASDGSYESLSNKPSINGVSLDANKTSAQLAISYNDLTNQPTIPVLTSTYTSSDENKAITGKGVANALNNYTPSTRTITGKGALQGGGDLSQNIEITHKSAPTGLQLSANKIGVDSYGHVQMGGAITATDIQAQPSTFNVQTDISNINGTYGTVFCILNTSGNLGLTSVTEGNELALYCVNNTSEPITITFSPSDGLSNFNNIYCNGSMKNSQWSTNIPSMSYTLMKIKSFTFDGNKYLFIDFN